MLKRNILAIFLLGIAIQLGACASSGSTLSKAPDFETIAGDGQLTISKPRHNEIQADIQAQVIVESNLSVGSESNCKGLSLKDNGSVTVLLASCPFDKYFVCPGGAQSCTPEKLGQASVNGNVFQIHSDWSDQNYRLELYPGKMVYRIQESKCMFSYPHDCFIKWFGWNDIKVLEFKKAGS